MLSSGSGGTGISFLVLSVSSSSGGSNVSFFVAAMERSIGDAIGVWLPFVYISI